MNKSLIWKHFNNMQKAIMASDSQVARQEFFAEPVSEQREYFNWMRSQSSNFLRPHWDDLVK